jgi:periplasmic divalent cation tolerance protein
MEAILVYITTANKAEAEKLAAALVGERLAACANIVDGIESVFWWEGKINHSREALCLLKSVPEKFPALRQRALELHSYETPCVVALPILDGNPDFLTWISESCS